MGFQSTLAPAYENPYTEGVLWRAVGCAERIAAACLLIILAPVLLLTSLLIVWLSRRSPLVAHLRVGRYGRPFWTLKFRTMWPGAGAAQFRTWQFGLVERIVEHPGPRLKSSADPRVTSRLARFCRRFSVDELPQLVNVLRGEMAMVGPRPLTREELHTHYAGNSAEVLSVRPGITGLWQVMGRSRLTYAERRRLDLTLVRRRSLRLYFGILLRTLPEVAAGRNSW